MASSSVLLPSSSTAIHNYRQICQKGLPSSSAAIHNYRQICRAGSYNFPFFRKWTAGSCPSPCSLFYSRGARAHQMREAVISSPPRVQNPSSSSPWLMLPPLIEADNTTTTMISFNFYSLAEDKVITLRQKELTDLMTKPNSHFVIKGSSHGWLAVFNPHNLELFLYNPISHRHIKLPPFHDLPNHPRGKRDCDVVKLILSCSPDDEENCRAVMIYNCINGLAFCCPGTSKEWTRIGDMSWWDEGRKPPGIRGYRDCVYSTQKKVFFCLTHSDELESWDLQDPSSPMAINTVEVIRDKYFDFFEKYKYPNFRSTLPVKELCVPQDYLVVADEDIFLLTRYVMESIRPDGSYVDYYDDDEGSQNHTHMTKEFDIHKCDPVKGGDLKYVDSSSLGGLALFIGEYSHSVALRANKFLPELKPNSIYFTDAFGGPELYYYDHEEPFGGHDIGIFSYEDKTISPCYYPCEVQSLKAIVPSPTWFFPN